MVLTAKEFIKVWQQQNPNVIHIPSEHELGLMEQYAKYYHEQKVKNYSTLNVVGGASNKKFCSDGKRLCDCMGLICSK